MKAKQKVSVGIDGITCVVSGVFVLDEIHYPRESLKPILKITPKNKTTEIGIILPHTIRKDNNIGFRVSDTKMLADVVQAINRGLKSTIHRDWSELYVRSVEVACTVDMNCTDKCAVDSAVKFLCRCLLQEDRVNKEKTEQGVNLVFLKEHYIDTDTYKQAISNQLNMTGTDIDVILKGINEYLMILAKKQIEIAFEQSEKEVQDLHQRTKEGIETARRAGKQIGQKKGTVLTVKKAIYAKQIILKHNKTFGGVLSDSETQIQAGISRNSLYLYKRELKEEIESTSIEETIRKYNHLVEIIQNKNK